MLHDECFALPMPLVSGYLAEQHIWTWYLFFESFMAFFIRRNGRVALGVDIHMIDARY